MRIACAQMDMRPGACMENHLRAEELVRRAAMEHGAEIVLLPETWNTGFFPEDVYELSEEDGTETKARFSSLARELSIGIVAGSIASRREGRLYNTAYVFAPDGSLAASYDKTHLFTPMGEHRHFTPGRKVCRFELMGLSCGLVICYDMRFPELMRTLALPGLDVVFAVSQWPERRISQLLTLSAARAIENQVFLALCNSCGALGDTRFGGNSRIFDPYGEALAGAGTGEEIISADIDPTVLRKVRSAIPVFRERRPELYDCCGPNTDYERKDIP